MNRNKILEGVPFSSEFSVEDWNTLLEEKLGKYFSDKVVFRKHKEILRTELINYVKLYVKPEYFQLFEWTFDLYKECIIIDKRETIKVLAESFTETSNTDMKWMTNVLIQPNHSEFSERDKISYYFKVIDEILEGVFKPRLKVLDKLVNFKLTQSIPNNSTFDFGKLIRDFPVQVRSYATLFLEDPLFSISTNQWRNIAAHKSFTINKNNIVIEYGRGIIQTLSISYNDFYTILQWTQDMYEAIRFGQVLIELNYIKDIVAELDVKMTVSIRLESSLLHIIHNMQIVGFEFVSAQELGEIFCLNVKGKIDHDVKSSLIHASQCLDRLSCAIHDDEFVRNKFQRARVCIVGENQNTIASATVSIETALKKAEGKLTLDEYLSNIDFDLSY